MISVKAFAYIVMSLAALIAIALSWWAGRTDE